ncbi:MAG TPA: uroporphyrinogen-III C-methyltransferase [Oscillatoriaceae cyanobacterium M33_DOE_052]|uniref:uroporphyrinogen-III C-methyltransferase n=1 Tax=Planktothricoides sp. SpSt-374 TaxID=2282167 RepID=A0A7C3VHV1_9CYAN|nr:uroporphyrinogen-III C-methyltransferase [Oscillatoriaceae cyanobacterium M33_DOE_052]
MGKAYLVGAGPGDAIYLTVRARELLLRAEVLIYDALVDSGVLELVPESCQQFYVGKRGGKPSWEQQEINSLLVEQCRQGKQVVRLKGGDPFIFGRCMSEIEALRSAGCAYEVVPGVSAALAAPELAGIPLTDPVMSRCFAVASGHQPEELDWGTLAKLETLVVLMGGRQLGEIVRQLMRYGKSNQTPVAIIKAGGTKWQEVWMGTLGDIVEKTQGESLSPCAITIGEVVRWRPYLVSEGATNTDKSPSPPVDQDYMLEERVTQPEMRKPLMGTTVLVTRSAAQGGEFRALLEGVGANVIEMPTIEIGPPSSWEQLDGAIARLSQFHWLILTSTNGVQYFFERLTAQGKDARALAGLKIAVVGKKTALQLEQHGITPDYIPPNFVADSLAETFPEDLSGKNILFPRVETGGREVLVAELTAKGAQVEEVPAYESGCPAKIDPTAWEALKNRQVDLITFASSKTVQYFCQLVEKKYLESQGSSDRSDTAATAKNKSWQDLLAKVGIASIGPATSKTCHSLLGKVNIEATEYTLEGLTKAISSWAKGG